MSFSLLRCREANGKHQRQIYGGKSKIGEHENGEGKKQMAVETVQKQKLNRIDSGKNKKTNFV